MELVFQHTNFGLIQKILLGCRFQESDERDSAGMSLDLHLEPAAALDGGEGVRETVDLLLFELLDVETPRLLLALVPVVCYGGMLMRLKGTSPVRRKSGDHPDLFPVSVFAA